MKKILILMSFIMAAMSSCMKDTFDNPAQPTDPAGVVANYKIADLKTLYKNSGKTVLTITEDYIISAIVTADDKSGNLYKEIVIQEEGTNGAAIDLKIDRSSLYNDLPIGRRVFIKLKGMALGNYNNLIQLGGYDDTITVPGSHSLGSAASSQIGVSILKGSLGHTIEPEVVTLSQLNDNYQYKLIKLEGAEFACAELGSTYADGINQQSADRTLTTLNGSVTVRTSGYCNFATTKIAEGNGSLTAIYTIYRTTKQLLIRDLNDVKMTSTTRNTPCGGGGGGGGGGTATSATIAEIRAMYAGNGVKVTDRYIEATVISDKSTTNLNSQNMVVQDATGGIVIRFASAHNYALGSKLKITFTGDSLTKYAGLMQVFVPSTSTVSSPTGGGNISPTAVTIANINANPSQYESTLVTISNTPITRSSGTTFVVGTNGNCTLNDGTGTMTLYSTSTAKFGASTLPTGNKSVTGIVGVFNTTKQLSIRGLSDIQ
jgi:hypothetical protein